MCKACARNGKVVPSRRLFKHATFFFQKTSIVFTKNHHSLHLRKYCVGANVLQKTIVFFYILVYVQGMRKENTLIFDEKRICCSLFVDFHASCGLVADRNS